MPTGFQLINPLKHVTIHKDSIYCLTTDPLGRVLITGADDNSIGLWMIPDLDPICSLVGHQHVITNLCLNSCCLLLVSSSQDSTVRIWLLADGTCAAVLSGFTTDHVHYATFSPSGSMVAGACEDGTIPLWVTSEALKGSPPVKVFKTPQNGAGVWVTFSPGGEFMAYSCEPSSVVVIALKALTQWSLELYTGPVSSMRFFSSFFTSGSDVGPRLMTVANEEGVFAVWCVEGGTWHPKFVFRHSGTGRRATKIHAWAVDAYEHVLVLAKTNAAYVCDCMSRETLGELPKSSAFENCTCIAANPAFPSIFFFGNNCGMMVVADIESRVVLTEVQSADEVAFTDAVWSRDGHWVFATDMSGSLTSFITFAGNDPQRDQLPAYVSHNLFDDRAGSFVDRKGKRLKYQPRGRDLRGLRLQFDVLQQPFLQASATELILIQHLVSQADRPTTTQGTAAPVGPPPLHVRLLVEFPVSPHAPALTGPASPEGDADTGVAAARFASDPDEWNFNCEEDGPDDPAPVVADTLVVYSSADVPAGVWETWRSLTVIDTRSYFPQVGDQVSVIWPVYLRVLEELGMPPEPRDAEVVEGTIEKIAIENGRLRLAMSGDVKIWFPVPMPRTFVVLTEQMEAARRVARALKPHDVVGVFAIGPDLSVSFAKFDVLEGVKAAGIESVRVVAEDGAECRLSPWDVWIVNGEAVREAPAPFPRTPFVKALVTIAKQPANREWLHVIGKDDPAFLSGIEFPMSLMLVKERLDAGWYRSAESIANDLEILFQNIQAYHRDDAGIIEKAKEMRNMLSAAARAMARKRKLL
jgi:WD40 repeat protein